MIGGRSIASELFTEVGDKVWPCQEKYFECDVNELHVGRAITNGVKLEDEVINLLNVLVSITALHFNVRKSLGENKATLSILRLIPGL